MSQRDDTTPQQQNGQRQGGNRPEHQKGDSQTRNGGAGGPSGSEDQRQEQSQSEKPAEKPAAQ